MMRSLAGDGGVTSGDEEVIELKTMAADARRERKKQQKKKKESAANVGGGATDVVGAGAELMCICFVFVSM